MFSRFNSRFVRSIPQFQRKFSTTIHNSSIGNAWRKYNELLITNPIATKSISAGILSIGADISCQIVFPLDKEKKNLSPIDRVDWKRTFNFSLLNFFVVPPLMHYWYGLLATKVVGTTFFASVKRVVLDQALFAPFIISIFFSVNLFLNNELNGEVFSNKMQNDFVPTLLANYSVWVPAQLINFKFIPAHLNVLWANFVGFFWSIYLSNATNKKQNDLLLEDSSKFENKSK